MSKVSSIYEAQRRHNEKAMQHASVDELLAEYRRVLKELEESVERKEKLFAEYEENQREIDAILKTI